MAFRPNQDDLTEMDSRIFLDAPMGLAADLLHLDLAERIALDQGAGRLFVTLEKMRVRTLRDFVMIRHRVEQVCAPLGHRVDAIVNYDGFRLEEDVASDYASMVANLEDRYYGTVTRYSGSAFLRLMLREALKSDATHIFASRELAQSALDTTT